MADTKANTAASAARWPKRTGFVTGGIVSLVGLLVLFGWYTRNTFLIQIEPDLAPMQYSGALSFLLLGSGLIAVLLGWRAVGAILGGLAAIFSLLTLAEYASNISLGIDELFYKAYVTVRVAQPGRLAPNTATCFFLAGAALVLFGLPLRSRLRPPVLGLLGSLVFAFGAVAVGGYLFDIQTAYGWGNLTDMALHTALSFMALGAGVVALSWHDAVLSGVSAPRWLPLLVGVGSGTITLLLWQALRALQEEYGGTSDLPQVVLANGLLVAALLVVAVYLAQEGRTRARQAEAANIELRREVVDRKRAEADAQLERNRLQTVVEVLPVGILVADAQGRFVQSNNEAREIWGEALPLPDGVEQYGEYKAWRVDTGERITAEKWALARALALGETSLNEELKIETFDGKEKIILNSATPILDADGTILGGVVGIIDITERKMAEQRLAESEHNYRTLMEQASDGIFVFDPSGKLVDVNPSACEMVGYTRDELLRMNFADLVAPINLKSTPLRFGELQEGKTVRVERDLVRQDGTLLPTEMSERMVDPGRLQSIVRDITERKRAEVALKQMNEELERRVVERTAQLQEAVKELEAFSYSVSHDLRAPLRALTGFSDGLLEDYGGKLDAEGQRYLEMIRNNARNMGQLIDDLLAFSRLGRQQMGESRIDMAQLARSIADDLRMENQDRQIKFVIGDLPPVQGDRSMIRQVFTNLLTNAVKFTRKREVARVEVGSYEEAGKAVYYVRDNGAGFDMQYAHKLFGVFQRLHSTREFEGNGVGLALVQRIVNRHGGRVWAEGHVNEGATFYFSLPLTPDRRPQTVAAPSQLASGNVPPQDPADAVGAAADRAD